MKMFDTRKGEKLFVFLSNSFKSKIGRGAFSEAVKNAFETKQTSPLDLATFKLTEKEVETLYQKVKAKYI